MGLANLKPFVSLIKFLSELSLSDSFAINGNQYYLKSTDFKLPKLSDAKGKIIADEIKIYFFIHALSKILAGFAAIRADKIFFKENSRSIAEKLDEQLAGSWPSCAQFVELILNNKSWQEVLLTLLLYHKNICYYADDLQKEITILIFQDNSPEIKKMVAGFIRNQKVP